jgi:hypothetical protein
MPYNQGLWQQYPQVYYYNQFVGELIRAVTQPQRSVVVEDEPDMLNTFQVGTDPEFILISPDGRTIPAQNHFGHFGEIGYDHGGRIAELRPKPAKGTYTLLKHIQALVKRPELQAINGKLRAGGLCNGESLGGHVHLGFKAFDQQVPAGYGTRHGYQLNAKADKVTKALDALTKVLEHLDILPKKESAERRAHVIQGYGMFGDVRDSNGHMEYRTMASWLYDPKVAFLCLTAAKLAACDPEGTIEALKDCNSFTKLSKWLDQYKEKDLDAKRASEKLLEKGLKVVQVDPGVDFRGRWEGLP